MSPAALSAESSIKFWMKDIRWTPQTEHVTLQAKAVPGSSRGSSSNPSSNLEVPSGPALPACEKETSKMETSGRPGRFDFIFAYMEQSVHLVNKILKRLEKLKSTNIEAFSTVLASDSSRNLIMELSRQIVKMCCEFENRLQYPKDYWREIPALLDAEKTQTSLRQQATILSALTPGTNTNDRQNSIISSISKLHRLFMEQIVLVDCQILVRSLRASTNSATLTRTADIISALANHGNHVRKIFCQIGAVSSLLSPNQAFDMDESTRVSSLRCLANISCHSDCLMRFEEEGNFQKLIALLWINGNSDAVRCETAGVLAQVAAHLVPQEQANDISAAATVALLNELIDALPPVIRALIHVSKNARNEETLLVVAACICNLSFLHSVTPVLELLCQQDCMASLLRAWRNGYAKSLSTKNQIIGTLLILSGWQFGQISLLKVPSLAEFLIDVLNQCLRNEIRDGSESIIRDHVVRKSLIVLERLLKEQEFRTVFLRAQGIALYHEALKSGKGGGSFLKEKNENKGYSGSDS